MRMRRGLRKFALIAHLTFSLGWVGAVLSYLALGLSAATSRGATTVRAAWIGMELTGWGVIVPLAVATLLTGVVLALGTSWGLFRHYWVVITLGLSTFCVVVTVLHMLTVSATADVARTADPAELSRLGSDLFHPGVGLVVLLVITVLNVYKPRGRTRYGQRKQPAQRGALVGGPDPIHGR